MSGGQTVGDSHSEEERELASYRRLGACSNLPVYVLNVIDGLYFRHDHPGCKGGSGEAVRELLYHLRQEMVMAWTRMVTVEVVKNDHQLGIYL